MNARQYAQGIRIMADERKANQDSRLQQFNRREEDYFKLEPGMTKEQFWWNHLTYRQREFIVKECMNKRIVYGEEFSIESAHKTNWNNVEGYPK
jgi:hypothetical protein